MRRVLPLCRCLLMLTCLLFWTGCLFTEVPDGPACDESRRCGPGDAEVCGANGQTYSCASYATCLGVVLDDTGQSCVTEPPVCPALGCDLDCPQGYVQDDNGCDTCTCVDACAPVLCQLACPFGFETGPDGCEICACAPEPACDDVTCDLFCEFGYQVGPDGCEVCACNEPPACPDVDCPAEECPLGRRFDENGCETCECVGGLCEPLECPEPEFCEFGYQVGPDGCDTCVCAPRPACEDVTCELFCEFGFKVDPNGCEVCACNERPMCRRDEDCALDQACIELDVAVACCPDGAVCDASLLPCPKACTQVSECDDSTVCPRGTFCTTAERSDCCGADEDCDLDVPACPFVCL